MRSKIFNLDWDTFDYKDKEQRKQLAGALQVYMSVPDRFIPNRFAQVQEFIKAHGVARGEIQEFGIPSNFPVDERAIDVVRKFQIMPEYDNGYERIFDVLNFEGTRATGFDVMDIAGGLTFREVKIGEKLKVYQMAGEKERCYFSFYGGALGWHRSLFEDQAYWLAEQNAIEFRGKAYGHRASVYYGLLEAAADSKGCCAANGDTDDATAIMNSLNFAATTIFTNLAGKGYNLSPQTTSLVVLVPLGMTGRVRQALGVRGQAFSDSPLISNYNFTVIPSMMLTNANRVMVIMPGIKILAGYRMDLTLFDDFDILSYTDTVAGWMRYGGCIGDLDQIECIEFTALSGSCPTSPDSGVGAPEAPEEQ